MLGERAPGNAPYGFPYPEVLDYRNQETGLTDLTGSTCAPFSVTEGDKPEMIWGEMTSANYFSPLEVQQLQRMHIDQVSRAEKRDVQWEIAWSFTWTTIIARGNAGLKYGFIRPRTSSLGVFSGHHQA